MKASAIEQPGTHLREWVWGAEQRRRVWIDIIALAALLASDAFKFNSNFCSFVAGKLSIDC